MTGHKKQNLERGVDNFCAVCERVMLRTLLFGCFTFEVCRFVRWLWFAGPR
jgi:hypothetical protein